MQNSIETGIVESDRKKIAEGLERLLADTYTLYLKTHVFHWNVTGNLFGQLHLLFETQYQELWKAVDPIAERIRALGFTVRAMPSQLQRLTSIEETEGVPSSDEMIDLLLQGHEEVARNARPIVSDCERAGDHATVDLLIERLTAHEKAAWMLRSLLAPAPHADAGSRYEPADTGAP